MVAACGGDEAGGGDRDAPAADGSGPEAAPDRPPDLAADAGAEVQTAGDAGHPIDGSPGGCATSGMACPAEQFCSLARGVCIPAAVKVAAGQNHTCSLHVDGSVRCWGWGAFIGPGLPPVTPPIRVELPARAVGLAVGIQAACAVLEADPGGGGTPGGAVRCWGDLGPGPSGPTTILGESGAPLAGVTQLAGGSMVFCAVNAAGVHCWGPNQSGELARPLGSSFPPTTAVLSLPQSGLGPEARLATTVAVLVHDGRMRLCGWGNNDSGLTPGARGIATMPRCRDDLPGLVQISAGDGHVCARRGEDRFSCWGANSGGQLGTGDENQLEADLPGAEATLDGPIRDLAAGAYFTCALLDSGAVRCWGNNDHGECGRPASAALFSPSPTGEGWPALRAIGSGAGAQHSCGILADGSIRCWGYDDKGQLGAGATGEDADRQSPTPVPVRF